MISHIPTRRRRSYTPAFRLQVIAETRRPGTSVAEVARRHDLNTNVVFHWLRDPRYNGKAGTPAFLPVEARPAVLVQEAAASGRIDVVIELAGGARKAADFVKGRRGADGAGVPRHGL
jgi:transposase